MLLVREKCVELEGLRNTIQILPSSRVIESLIDKAAASFRVSRSSSHASRVKIGLIRGFRSVVDTHSIRDKWNWIEKSVAKCRHVSREGRGLSVLLSFRLLYYISETMMTRRMDGCSAIESTKVKINASNFRIRGVKEDGAFLRLSYKNWTCISSCEISF